MKNPICKSEAKIIGRKKKDQVSKEKWGIEKAVIRIKQS